MKKRILIVALAFLSLGVFETNAQCVAGFTYTPGPGGVITFSSTSTGVSANTRYTWYLGNGNILPNVADTASYTYPYNGTYHVKLIASDSAFGGCYDSTSLNITVSNASNTPCMPANFTYTVSGGQVTFSMTNPTQYNSWAMGNGWTTTNQSTFTYTYTSNGTYQVTCYTQYLYPGYGFPLSCDTFSQSVQVTSVPCLSQFYADTTMFGGNGLIIHSTANGADSTFYSINGGAYTLGNIYQNGIDTFYNLPAGNNTICQMILGNGCMDSTCQTVTVNCSISETHTVGCGQVSFTTNSNQSITSAAWYIGGSLVSTQTNPVITFTNTSAFYISYDLQSSQCHLIDSVQITVGPTASFVVLPDTASGPHNWIVWVNNQPNYVSYDWDWGDGTYSNTPYPSHTYTVPAWYTICLTVHDNCGDSAHYCQSDSLYRSSSTMIGVTVQPQNYTNAIVQNNAGQIKIYPVPASDFLMLENVPSQSRAEIYDNEGRKVLSEVIFEKTSRINISDLASGFYVMKIHSNGYTWQKKLIKQ